MGLIVGVVLAIIYRKQGPQRPKYIYEIEKEMGIEPPDLEGQYWQRVKEEEEEEERRAKEEEIKIIYHMKNQDTDDQNV